MSLCGSGIQTGNENEQLISLSVSLPKGAQSLISFVPAPGEYKFGVMYFDASFVIFALDLPSLSSVW